MTAIEKEAVFKRAYEDVYSRFQNFQDGRVGQITYITIYDLIQAAYNTTRRKRRVQEVVPNVSSEV